MAKRLVRDEASGCHIWTGTRSPKGYGRITVNGRQVGAHRVAYELAKGPIPDGLVIDHLCRNPSCCNPEHLEAVTTAENTRRGLSGARQLARTHCPQGHPYDDENTYRAPGSKDRHCRACIANRDWKAAWARTKARRAESTDAPAFGAAEDAQRKSEKAAPLVYHYGAALHGIADEHADILTPRQRKALYEAGNLLWDAPTDRGVVVVSRAEARRLVNYAFMASSASRTPYIKENGVGYQESPWVEFLRIADRLWTVLFPDHPIRQIDPRLPAESGDASAVAQQRASALPAPDEPKPHPQKAS